MVGRVFARLVRVMVRLAARVARKFAGQRRYQPQFEMLYRLSLEGMNMGTRADDPRMSGEAGVLRSIPAGSTVFDVGASVGTYSELALTLVPGVRLLAFEPHPGAIAAWRSRIGDRARLYECGLGEAEGRTTLFGSAADSALSSTTQRVHSRLTWEPIGAIAIRALDDVCVEAGIERIDLLKLDVEGGELAVLRGGRRMIEEGRIERIQFEFGGTALDARIYLRDLVSALPGYRLHRIVRDGWVPVQYAEIWEIFTTTNFLAIRAA